MKSTAESHFQSYAFFVKLNCSNKSRKNKQFDIKIPSFHCVVLSTYQEKSYGEACITQRQPVTKRLKEQATSYDENHSKITRSIFM